MPHERHPNEAPAQSGAPLKPERNRKAADGDRVKVRFLFNGKHEAVAVRVPSATEEETEHIVRLDERNYRNPLLPACTCTAADNGRECWHVRRAVTSAADHAARGGKVYTVKPSPPLRAISAFDRFNGKVA